MDLVKYKNKLIDILREDVFTELMSFWKNIEESEFDFKIFVSKKCFVLYKAFRPLFNFTSFRPCIKLTDTAIPIYTKEMAGKKVLIVDDVFIHGRTSLRISKEVSKSAKEVKFYVFAKNTNQGYNQDISLEWLNDLIMRNMKKNNIPIDSMNMEDIDYESFYEIGVSNKSEKRKESSLAMQYKNVKGHINCSNEYQWKKISDSIMKCIWGVNMPYVSYLPIYRINNSDKLQKVKTCPKNQDLSTHRQERLQQHFTYSIRSSVSKYSKIHYCYIITENSFVKECKVVPMVFFDCENTSISKNFIYEALKIIYKDKAPALFEIFSETSQNNNWLISMLEYLIFSVGYLSGTSFLSAIGLKNTDYMVDCTNAQFSFGPKISAYLKWLLNISYPNDLLKRIEDCTIKNNNNVSMKINQKENSDLHNGLQEAFMSTLESKMEKNIHPIIDTLAKYFKYNNMYDELNVYKIKNENYVRGLKFSEIKDFLLDKNFSTEDIICGLMYQYNLGAATINFLYDYDQQDDIIGVNMYWRSGEQSYKCIANTYVLPVYYQNLYNSMFDRTISDFLCILFMEITERNYAYFDVPFSKRDYAKYCGRKDNVYDSFDIEEYCVEKEFHYLGFIGKQIEQYTLFGHVEFTLEKDADGFKKDFFDFLKRRTDKTTLDICEKILWDEGQEYC